ncbi:hypothetical protein [Anaeroselena agilis]|uniref:Uncharacterized protein n=1 Tax=Anaeroselena agilis TaxID=3063788 RepID=A0ABU3NV11_9FIRM|nr:hypothetical protein [Selenomonadales bacterium 4137-cl]
MEQQQQEELTPAQQTILQGLKYGAYVAVFMAMVWIMHGPQ